MEFTIKTGPEKMWAATRASQEEMKVVISAI
jgi:hypothetical protein